MKKYHLLHSVVMIAALLVGGCTSSGLQTTAPKAVKQDIRVMEPLKVPAFDSIHVGNGVDVQIQGVKSRQSVILMSKAPALRIFATHVRNRMLYLAFANGHTIAQRPHMRVVIYTPHLHRLIVRGNTNVYARNLRNTGLTLDTHGTGNIDLQGVTNIKKIVATGRHNITIYWVDSNKLQVLSSGGGTIRLAGRAKIFHTRLRNAARLDAKYLRADAIYIRTQDTATATILPTKILHAFARDCSNIYYYKSPKLLDANGWRSGNPLHLQEWR